MSVESTDPTTGGEDPAKKVFFVSLGCAKNQVDTEIMLGVVENEGHQIVDDPTDADTLVVNTCGFIEAAKEESIDTILELARLREESGKKLVVAGCLSQRYPEELAAEMPEVDHFLGSAGRGRRLRPSCRCSRTTSAPGLRRRTRSRRWEARAVPRHRGLAGGGRRRRCRASRRTRPRSPTRPAPRAPRRRRRRLRDGRCGAAAASSGGQSPHQRRRGGSPRRARGR